MTKYRYLIGYQYDNGLKVGHRRVIVVCDEKITTDKHITDLEHHCRAASPEELERCLMISFSFMCEVQE